MLEEFWISKELLSNRPRYAIFSQHQPNLANLSTRAQKRNQFSAAHAAEINSLSVPLVVIKADGFN